MSKKKKKTEQSLVGNCTKLSFKIWSYFSTFCNFSKYDQKDFIFDFNN